MVLHVLDSRPFGTLNVSFRDWGLGFHPFEAALGLASLLFRGSPKDAVGFAQVAVQLSLQRPSRGSPPKGFLVFEKGRFVRLTLKYNANCVPPRSAFAKSSLAAELASLAA